MIRFLLLFSQKWNTEISFRVESPVPYQIIQRGNDNHAWVKLEEENLGTVY